MMDHGIVEQVPWLWRQAYGRQGRLARVLAWLVRRSEAHTQLTRRYLDELYGASTRLGEWPS
jgi:hypothetical protein